jgi:hypothetical protein
MKTDEQQYHDGGVEGAIAVTHIKTLARAHGIASVVDAGAGNDRKMAVLKAAFSGLSEASVEPVPEVIAVERNAPGRASAELVEGKPTSIAIHTIELVTKTPVLDHVPNHARAIAGGVAGRVARRMHFRTAIIFPRVRCRQAWSSLVRRQADSGQAMAGVAHGAAVSKKVPVMVSSMLSAATIMCVSLKGAARIMALPCHVTEDDVLGSADLVRLAPTPHTPLR